MGRRQRVLLDVDGVLADFVTSAAKVVEAVTGAPLPADALEEWDIFRSYDEETRKKIYSACKVEGWCLGLEPYAGAVDFVRHLDEIADVYFVTSPMNGPHWAFEREQWLKKHFGTHHHKVVSTNAKYLCVGDVFVDDQFSHVEKWAKSHRHGVGVLWTQPYNLKDEWDYRATTYNHIIEYVCKG
jgi:5'(3')-deoxyribonucleotidase